MARSREITHLVAWIVALLAIALVVAQDATAQETSLPNAEANVERARAHIKKGDRHRAIADYTQAIRLSPTDASIYRRRGYMYYVTHNIDRAIADYTKAIQLDPKFALAYLDRASAYHYLGDNDRAAADFKQARKLEQEANEPSGR